MVLPPEPADPDVPWKRFLIPHPRFPGQKFFKSLLPQTYESAYPHLLTRFEAYWIKERRERWERKEVLDSLSVSATRMMDMSDKNYMARVRTLPNPSRPQDATTCISAIKEIDSKLNQLAQIHESLMHQKEGLFEPSSVTLKSWAKEQFAYSQKTLATTSDLKDKISIPERRDLRNPKEVGRSAQIQPCKCGS